MRLVRQLWCSFYWGHRWVPIKPYRASSVTQGYRCALCGKRVGT